MGNHPKILVYVGASKGASLCNMYQKFDKTYAFEPLPQNFELLKESLKNTNVILNNAACGIKNGVADFFVTKYHNSSSLGQINQDYLYTDLQISGAEIKEKIQVKVVNLFEYLTEQNIFEIDTLVTDCQGSDLNVLKTIIPTKIVITNIITETHQNNKPIYQGLSNEFNDHCSLLNDHYDFLFGTVDGRGNQFSKSQLLSMIEVNEWNSYWRKKI